MFFWEGFAGKADGEEKKRFPFSERLGWRFSTHKWKKEVGVRKWFRSRMKQKRYLVRRIFFLSTSSRHFFKTRPTNYPHFVFARKAESTCSSWTAKQGVRPAWSNVLSWSVSFNSWTLHRRVLESRWLCFRWKFNQNIFQAGQIGQRLICVLEGQVAQLPGLTKMWEYCQVFKLFKSLIPLWPLNRMLTQLFQRMWNFGIRTGKAETLLGESGNKYVLLIVPCLGSPLGEHQGASLWMIIIAWVKVEWVWICGDTSQISFSTSGSFEAENGHPPYESKDVRASVTFWPADFGMNREHLNRCESILTIKILSVHEISPKVTHSSLDFQVAFHLGLGAKFSFMILESKHDEDSDGDYQRSVGYLEGTARDAGLELEEEELTKTTRVFRFQSVPVSFAGMCVFCLKGKCKP